MTQSFLPKPLLFKEWKEHRWWMVAAFLLLVYGPFSSLLALLMPSHAGSRKDLLLWKGLIPALYHFQYTPESGGGYPPASSVVTGSVGVSALAVIVAMGLMIALVTVERNRGTLMFTLSFPIRRSTLLRVKIVLAVGIVLTAFILNFLLLLGIDIAAKEVVPVALLFAWLGKNLLIAGVLMGLGLACAAVIQAGMMAGISAFLLAAFPWALGVSVLRSVPSSSFGFSMQPVGIPITPISHEPATPASHVSMFLRALSPTSYLSPSGGGGGGSFNGPVVITVGSGHDMNIGVVCWFLLLTAVMGYVGYRAYLAAPVESNMRWFQFREIQPWYLSALFGALSFFVINALTGSNTHLSHTPYVLTGYWFILWFAVVLIGFLVRQTWRRRLQS